MVSLARPPRADDALHCFGEDIDRRIDGCTALIERRDPTVADLSAVYAMRALAYSLKGQYDTAINDYDVAINMRPDFAVALNNRAWAYFRWGKAATGLPDVERSLQLSPTSPHSLDTRAHIRQALGDPQAALRDYNKAMFFGGSQHDQALPVRADRGGPLQRRDRRHVAAGAADRHWSSACATRTATRCPPTSSAGRRHLEGCAFRGREMRIVLRRIAVFASAAAVPRPAHPPCPGAARYGHSRQVVRR